MKITKLHAENVHGYLPIDVEFFDDLTFLTGLNGSGKTTALRLLMALLTPNIKELGSIAFTKAEVTAMDDNQKVLVMASKSSEGIELSISSIDEPLKIGRADLDLFLEIKRPSESFSQIQELFISTPVFEAIKKVSTPMFLGLDRRFIMPDLNNEDMDDLRRREYMARRHWPADSSHHLNTRAEASLIDVNFLAVSCMQQIRADQEQLDDKLRASFFTKAFEYKPSKSRGELPSLAELEKYRTQLSKIGQAAEETKIPMPEIQAALTDFFNKMTSILEYMDEKTKAEKTKVKNKRGIKTTAKRGIHISEGFLTTTWDSNYIEWIMNGPQVDRILEHLRLLNDYIDARKALRDRIDRFQFLVNSFLSQTNKQVFVNNSGQLNVSVGQNSKSSPISALSSGERQLLVMLAHLSLNPSLEGSGIFIVDEPELSLHIDWQEKFVDAITEANPKVQLILATHSPAIILDRVASCRSLS